MNQIQMSMNDLPSFSEREEQINTITHGVGVIASVVGLLMLVAAAFSTGSPWGIASSIIYGSSLIFLYLSSTIYHASRNLMIRDSYKSLDHCAIYLLIAGSYTPFLLVDLRASVGWSLFAAVWGIAFAGILLKVFFRHRFGALRVATYLLMGWLAVFAWEDFTAYVNSEALNLLILGGVIYSVGVLFYAVERIPYNHAIWHVFVMGGSICHFFAVYNYVLIVN